MLLLGGMPVGTKLVTIEAGHSLGKELNWIRDTEPQSPKIGKLVSLKGHLVLSKPEVI